MTEKYSPINPKCPHLLHGADYNPDQWIETPEIWNEDMRLMKLAHCNAMAIGIFSWVKLEPEEGHYDFAWMDTVMDNLTANGAFAVLATPSGARPAWMSQKYPEVLRVTRDRRQQLHGHRHNHCFTSPIYRQKTAEINRKLAERYASHPALLLWHVSNEFSGECHCNLCQEAFRQWLRRKYENDLDKLNRAWWTSFWSHTFSDWSQIESPSPLGESEVHGHNLDWNRFVTAQTIDFYKNEIAPLRELSPDVPITTNFMGLFLGINYGEFAREVDVVSWDSYPAWHGHTLDWKLAAHTSFVHDMYRAFKGGKPWMLMESTPSQLNWHDTNKLKRPEMHKLSSLLAIAHGSDTVQYFQWRKSRGASEKFHGAVVDHAGHENTRVFREVAELGEMLSKLDAVVGTSVQPEVAVLYDWENRWAIDDVQALSKTNRNYEGTCSTHYRPFWSRGVAVDVIDQTRDFDGCKLLIAPMLYLLRSGVAEKLERFVAGGGTLVMTYWSGIADENDLVFLGGWPGGGLRAVLGIWDEEIDSLYETDRNRLVFSDNNALGMEGEYEVFDYCSLIHAETAEVLATYGDDFYAGRPALTVNHYGDGTAYYIAARTEEKLLDNLYDQLIKKLSLRRVLDADLPEGVTVQLRHDGERQFLFFLNFKPTEANIQTRDGALTDLLSGETVRDAIHLPGYGVRVLARSGVWRNNRPSSVPRQSTFGS